MIGTESRLTSLSEEHGVVAVAHGDAFKVGQRVRVLPNHACPTAAAHDRYRVVVGRNVVDEWERVNGW